MALNLNKGGDENTSPNSKKKVLNLNKSVDEAKSVLNLNKEEAVSKETTTSKSVGNELGSNKKNPTMLILFVVLIVGGGLFWFLNRGTTKPEQTSKIKEDNPGSSAPMKVKEAASPDNNSNKQGPSNSVNLSIDPSTDKTESNSSENNVSVPSDIVIESKNEESSKSKVSKKLKTTSTSVPLATTPIGSIDEKVNQVLRGDFGNGLERKKALAEEYALIQAKVNELYRNKKN